MKKLILLTALLVFDACAASQAPQPGKGIMISGLSISDTIDFGLVRVGVAKDTTIVFRNAGADTIHIISQRFSDSEFSLSSNSQTTLNIAPGDSASVKFRFLPSDTTSIVCQDTIRTADKSYILAIQGVGTPFSRTFLAAPREIIIRYLE